MRLIGLFVSLNSQLVPFQAFQDFPGRENREHLDHLFN